MPTNTTILPGPNVAPNVVGIMVEITPLIWRVLPKLLTCCPTRYLAMLDVSSVICVGGAGGCMEVISMPFVEGVYGPGWQ